MQHAAELDANNTVIRVIVGTAEWATANLGGVWVDSPKCGPGWTYHDGEFHPPYVEPVEPDDDGDAG
jgi:hypothetical protein